MSDCDTSPTDDVTSGCSACSVASELAESERSARIGTPRSSSGLTASEEQHVSRMIVSEVMQLGDAMFSIMRDIEHALEMKLKETSTQLRTDTQSIAGRLRQCVVAEVQKLLWRIENERHERTSAVEQIRKDLDLGRHGELRDEVTDLRHEVSSLQVTISEAAHNKRSFSSVSPRQKDAASNKCNLQLQHEIAEIQSSMDWSRTQITGIEASINDIWKEFNGQRENCEAHTEDTRQGFFNLRQEIRDLYLDQSLSVREQAIDEEQARGPLHCREVMNECEVGAEREFAWRVDEILRKLQDMEERVDETEKLQPRCLSRSDLVAAPLPNERVSSPPPKSRSATVSPVAASLPHECASSPLPKSRSASVSPVAASLPSECVSFPPPKSRSATVSPDVSSVVVSVQNEQSPSPRPKSRSVTLTASPVRAAMGKPSVGIVRPPHVAHNCQYQRQKPTGSKASSAQVSTSVSAQVSTNVLTNASAKGSLQSPSQQSQPATPGTKPIIRSSVWGPLSTTRGLKRDRFHHVATDRDVNVTPGTAVSGFLHVSGVSLGYCGTTVNGSANLPNGQGISPFAQGWNPSMRSGSLAVPCAVLSKRSHFDSAVWYQPNTRPEDVMKRMYPASVLKRGFSLEAGVPRPCAPTVMAALAV